ncbi:MAG: hypothetical protein HY010_09815 [Acidobacteria bacterium]|nr:hypothetical protein [Acidobacteriota bacterium]
MATQSLDRLLTRLEESRFDFGVGGSAQVLLALRALEKARFKGAPSLIRFHETLLFLRAFPQGPAVVRKAESLLNSFWKRVAALRASGEDLSEWDTFEFAGVAGTTMEDTLGYDVARWLVGQMPDKVEIAWDNCEPGRTTVTTWPRFMPLLEDDAFVEADTPWQKWMETARGKKSRSAEWLIRQFENLSLPDSEKAELYDSLRLPLRWDLDNALVSRTRNWNTVRSGKATARPEIFYHDGPLISRSEVSLAKELAKKPPALIKLSRRDGERVMDAIREVMLVRYRELYGTTLGDPASVVRADVGRGVSIYFWNLPPERRLPLRSYVAGFSFKNGVPINYIEAIGLCEWMEVGFNTFYTFRGGEAGWVYAQVLRGLCHLMGTTCVSVYPYQLGHDNEEAIESGAFWFYRKLGFRPGRPELLRLVQSEEKKIAANPKYRTSARTLRRLAASHVFYDLPASEIGAWDRFSTRNIGLRVNARMARDFGGDARVMRAESARKIAKMLGMNTASWTALDKANLENFSVALMTVRDLSSWTRAEKDALVQIIRAKGANDEMKFLHLTQQHQRFRDAIRKMGS